jgi:hypothetical protein
MRGVSRSVAKDLMGRKTEAIYARYRIVAEDEKASALIRMMQQRKPFAPTEPIDQVIAVMRERIQ